MSSSTKKINPKHYTSHPSGIECIEVTQHMNFNLGNAVKYIWRNGLKDGEPSLDDLDKAIWYLNKERQRIEYDKQVDNGAAGDGLRSTVKGFF